MLTNVAQIPSVGCFRLSLGHSAVGNFAGHVLTINVNKEGEVCQVDGSPFNCSGCIDSSRDGCPAMLNVHSRDDDGFINFNVARKIADNAYAGTQEGLEYCPRRYSFDQPGRLNFDQGPEAVASTAVCG
jgi:hypothetical protein